MKKKSGKTLMQKWKNKIGGKLSALDKKKLVLTNIPYALAAFYADRAFFSLPEQSGRRYGEQTIICNGTRRPDFCWFCVKQ